MKMEEDVTGEYEVEEVLEWMKAAEIDVRYSESSDSDELEESEDADEWVEQVQEVKEEMLIVEEVGDQMPAEASKDEIEVKE